MENEGSVRNGGAIAKKKMKIAIAAATAPISGRVTHARASDRFTCAGASAVFGGWVAGVVAGELMVCSRERGGPGEPDAGAARSAGRGRPRDPASCRLSPGCGQRRLFAV